MHGTILPLVQQQQSSQFPPGCWWGIGVFVLLLCALFFWRVIWPKIQPPAKLSQAQKEFDAVIQDGRQGGHANTGKTGGDEASADLSGAMAAAKLWEDF